MLPGNSRSIQLYDFQSNGQTIRGGYHPNQAKQAGHLKIAGYSKSRWQMLLRSITTRCYQYSLIKIGEACLSYTPAIQDGAY